MLVNCVADVQEFEQKVVGRSSRSKATKSKQDSPEKDEKMASEDGEGAEEDDEDEDNAPRRPVRGFSLVHIPSTDFCMPRYSETNCTQQHHGLPAKPKRLGVIYSLGSDMYNTCPAIIKAPPPFVSPCLCFRICLLISDLRYTSIYLLPILVLYSVCFCSPPSFLQLVFLIT